VTFGYSGGLTLIPRDSGRALMRQLRDQIAQVRARPADTKKMARELMTLVSLVSILSIAAPAASHACRYAGKSSPELGDRAARSAVICLVNKRRKKHGLRALRVNFDLTQAASGHSYDMVMNGYFSHTSPGGASPMTRIKLTGYTSGALAWGVGETLGWGVGGGGTPNGIVRGWMHSAGHRHVLLTRSWRQIGVGVTWGSPGNPGSNAGTYTADFGYRR
jgi:uncharacterized protein YkwD